MPLTTAAMVFEYALVAIGLLLAWRLHFSPAARKDPNTFAARLPLWRGTGFGAGIAILAVGFSWLMASFAWGMIAGFFPAFRSNPTLAAAMASLIGYLVILGGIRAAILVLKNDEANHSDEATSDPDKVRSDNPGSRSGLWIPALATAAITIGIVMPVQAAWEWLLVQLNFPVSNQDAITLFTSAESLGVTALLVTSAVVGAPVVEELVFRGGLFRLLRGRVPRWLALLLPSLIFAGLHVTQDTLAGLNTLAPLTVFGIIFSLAYERTGRIGVVILAHAFFNLNTVVFILSGLAE